MSFETRLITAGEVRAYLTFVRRVFAGVPPSDRELAYLMPTVDVDRSLAIFDGEIIVGTASALPLRMTVPGGTAVEAAGVTRVAVRATHRRRGLLTRMMRRQLDDLRARGERFAGLWASEAGIYGRFGYGLSTYQSTIDIERQKSALRESSREDSLSEVDPDDASDVLPEIVSRVAVHQPGLVQLNHVWWRGALADYPEQWSEHGELSLVTHQGIQGTDGYAIYRRQVEVDTISLHIFDLLAETTEAYMALWRYCLGVDLVAHVVAHRRSVDEPLRHLLSDSRAARTMVSDALWLRLIDIPAALECRRYSSEGQIRLGIHDSFCDWNTGTYLLEGGPAGVQCARIKSAPDLVMSAATLAACYLGGNRFTTLAAAGLVQENTEGSLERADSMFASSVTPWNPFYF